jgi:hypothetical protein
VELPGAVKRRYQATFQVIATSHLQVSAYRTATTSRWSLTTMEPRSLSGVRREATQAPATFGLPTTEFHGGKIYW